jgi:RNA polymerase sigma-70 factor, ECF subfamily
VQTDEELLHQLRLGEESAFAELVERYHTRLVRLACLFVANHVVAEDAAQETWLAVVRGIEKFEGRSSLRTWLFSICVNRARSIGGRENRMAPIDPREPSLDPARFGARGTWVSPPRHFTDEVDDRLEAAALAPYVRRAMESLPEAQRQVVTMHDAEGLSSRDVCDVLSISEANQRVLLHRGRARIRSFLEHELGGG